jgi:D-alanyl-D-alanine carboxypeptidase
MVRHFGTALIALALWTGTARAADIAVEVASGAILTETDADSLRLPASLAKLMTAFVAFEAIEAGEISADSQVTVSKFAAARPPVKLRLRAGSEIAFDEVLGAAVLGSKNDAAVVVAEAVAGSEAAFVARMNNAARRLGMTNSRFANATGLPAPDQQTTARDMALLSRALLIQFPQRAQLLSRRSVTARGQRVSTTNPLFGRVAGAEGLKTGFTCAAGYSIAALVERDGRRVIAITLGHASKNTRLRAVRGLISAAFKLSPSGDVLAAGPLRSGAPPDIGACSGAPATLLATDISPEEKALYAAELAKARARVGSRVAQRPVVVPARPAPPAPPPAPPPLFGWAVFLGAQSSQSEARVLVEATHRRLGKRGTIRIERRARDGRSLALIYGLDQPTASALCKAVSRYCVTLTPARLLNPKAQWRR